MTAYVIMIRKATRDADALDAYRALARRARGDHPPGIKVFYEHTEALEGPQVEGFAVLEFSTLGAAKAWYGSPAYQEAKKKRQQGADYVVYLVEGTPSPA